MQSNREQSLEFFTSKCKTHNLNITPQRKAIYEAMMDSSDHPTCEDIYSKVKCSFPFIAVDTVYRTLSTFVDIGLISEVEGYSQTKRYDPKMQKHHHFKCRKCGRIIDFQEKRFDKLNVPKKIKDKHSVSDIKVTVEGVCERCLKK